MSALTHHGGRLSDARARFGGNAADWIDLSTGINPNAWSPPADLTVDWRALPDPSDLADLERVVAAYFGVAPTHCLAVPGSETALRSLGQLLQLPGRHQRLCYSTHVNAFAPARPVTGDDDGEPSVLVLANPNNPDGVTTSHEALMAALARQESRGGWLLVDEAFVDCDPRISVAAQVSNERRLIVTRSFGKFFGLAGVRLGFVIAPPSILARLRERQGEWPVCSAALAFGSRAYRDSVWIEATRRDLSASALRLDTVLRRYGLEPRGDCPLFRLVETPLAQRLFAELARAHILTRAFADHPHLLRFGLPGDDVALARLDAQLAVFCG